MPPFIHIDLTVTRQQKNEDLRKLLPPYVMVEKVGPVEGVSLEDMVDIDLMLLWTKQTGTLPTIQNVMRQNPNVARYMTRFRPYSVPVGDATLKYFPCRPTAALEAFDEHTGHCFSGRSTPQVFQDMVNQIGSPEEIGVATHSVKF